MANIRYAKYPKNQKVLQTSEKHFYHGEHPICQISEKLKSAANIRKAAFPGQTSDMSDIRKTKKCCIHAKISFTRATHAICQTSKKKKKVLQTSEKQLFHGKHPMCQISEKLKSAANIRKAAFPGQASDMSDIRKTKKCCIHAKTSFTRANIRYVKHLKSKKCCKHPKTSFTMANIRYVRHPKKQKVLQTSENQLFRATHPICQTSKKKTKSAANIRKAAFPGQASDMSDIRKTKKCCIHAKTSFTRANIRYVKHLKNQKMLQTSENQFYHGEHPICQISEKPKSAANIRKAVLP